MNVTTKDRTIKTSAWFIYTLIVLEILFMVSPFAAYYYSIYTTPLNALQDSQYTAWLTMYLLPHFAYSDSWLANGLILISWPLILFGIVLFVFGFCQIYWSKLTSKAAVEVGLYRFIRHPMYVGESLATMGFCVLMPSVFNIVVTAIFITCQRIRAAFEERKLCASFPEYGEYLEKTGAYFPKLFLLFLSALVPLCLCA